MAKGNGQKLHQIFTVLSRYAHLPNGKLVHIVGIQLARNCGFRKQVLSNTSAIGRVKGRAVDGMRATPPFVPGHLGFQLRDQTKRWCSFCRETQCNDHCSSRPLSLSCTLNLSGTLFIVLRFDSCFFYTAQAMIHPGIRFSCQVELHHIASFSDVFAKYLIFAFGPQLPGSLYSPNWKSACQIPMNFDRRVCVRSWVGPIQSDHHLPFGQNPSVDLSCHFGLQAQGEDKGKTESIKLGRLVSHM